MSDAMARRSLAAILALGMGVAGCGTTDKGPPAGASASGSVRPVVHGVTFARAKAAYRRYRNTIRRRYPGVQGAHVGVVVLRSKLPKPDDPVYGIIVLVDRPGHMLQTSQAVNGVPLRFRVGGHTPVH